MDAIHTTRQKTLRIGSTEYFRVYSVNPYSWNYGIINYGIIFVRVERVREHLTNNGLREDASRAAADLEATHKINSFRHDSYLSLSEGRKEKEPTGGSQGRLLIGAALALAS